MQRLSNMPMNLLPTASTSWKTSATFGRMIRKKKDCRVRNTKEAILEAHFPPGSGNWCTWMFGRNLSNWDESFTLGQNGLPLPVTLSASMKSKETRNVTMNLLYGMTADGATIIRQTIYAFMYKCRSAFNSIIYLRYADILLLKAEAKNYGRGSRPERCSRHHRPHPQPRRTGQTSTKHPQQ